MGVARRAESGLLGGDVSARGGRGGAVRVGVGVGVGVVGGGLDRGWVSGADGLDRAIAEFRAMFARRAARPRGSPGSGSASPLPRRYQRKARPAPVGGGGGAGGGAGGGERRGATNQRSNTDVYLTGADPAVCVATADPFDRAHGVRDPRSGGTMLMPACASDRRGRPRGKPLPMSTARRYPPCLLNMAGVSIDSVFDATLARRRELGLDDEHEEAVPDARAIALGRLGMTVGSGNRSLRSKVSGKTRTRR